jgi:hypothetical protein
MLMPRLWAICRVGWPWPRQRKISRSRSLSNARSKFSSEVEGSEEGPTSLLIQFESDPKQKELVWQFVLPATREDQKMTGAGTCFGNIMFMHGLPAPLIQNPRARFYFTEKGWNKVGRFVTSEAQKKGFVMRVIRRKNPASSQIVYRDDLQVALLPTNWKRKDR